MVTCTLETIRSSEHSPARTNLSFITDFASGYVMEILGASVSTDSPSPTSQDKMKTESNIKSTAGRHTKNFFIYTPRKKVCNANYKKIKIRTLFLVSYGYA